MPELVFLTHGVHEYYLSGQLTILVLVGAGYGLVRLVADCMSMLRRRK